MSLTVWLPECVKDDSVVTSRLLHNVVAKYSDIVLLWVIIPDVGEV